MYDVDVFFSTLFVFISHFFLSCNYIATYYVMALSWLSSVCRQYMISVWYLTLLVNFKHNDPWHWIKIGIVTLPASYKRPYSTQNGGVLLFVYGELIFHLMLMGIVLFLVNCSWKYLSEKCWALLCNYTCITGFDIKGGNFKFFTFIFHPIWIHIFLFFLFFSKIFIWMAYWCAMKKKYLYCFSKRGLLYRENS